MFSPAFVWSRNVDKLQTRVGNSRRTVRLVFAGLGGDIARKARWVQPVRRPHLSASSALFCARFSLTCPSSSINRRSHLWVRKKLRNGLLNADRSEPCPEDERTNAFASLASALPTYVSLCDTQNPFDFSVGHPNSNFEINAPVSFWIYKTSALSSSLSHGKYPEVK